jgi:hypothetical protein
MKGDEPRMKSDRGVNEAADPCLQLPVGLTSSH